jgi:hypothetical protein
MEEGIIPLKPTTIEKYFKQIRTQGEGAITTLHKDEDTHK